MIALFALLPLACQASAQAPTPTAPASSGVIAGPSMESDPTIVATILKLMDVKDTHPPEADKSAQGFQELMTLGTPQGQLLRNRYYYLGIPLSDSLVATTDPRLKEQMLEIARWDRENAIRSVALVTLAGRRDPELGKYFNEALNNPKAPIRFAALEALEVWNKDPDVKQMLQYVLRSETQPILKVYAGQALLRRGGEEGRAELLKQLDSGDWLARAMAARYLGELGKGEDYDLLLRNIDREQSNMFALAEYAIACLKLFPKKTPSAAPVLPPPPSAVTVAGGEDELDPLVITAPRLKIPATALIDGRINAYLMRLLETPGHIGDDNNPSLLTLRSLESPMGIKLISRYTDLGFLLTEGLAGVSDLLLRERILKVAQQGRDPQIRAAALLAIAYNHSPGDRGLFQEALLSQNVTVRFGAVEALQVWNQPYVAQDIANVGRMDLSGFLQTYAAGIAWRRGEAGGRDVVVRHWDDPDWVVRSLAIRFLGELGTFDDFQRILFQLDRETNNWVKAEMAGALLRLNGLRPR